MLPQVEAGVAALEDLPADQVAGGDDETESEGGLAELPAEQAAVLGLPLGAEAPEFPVAPARVQVGKHRVAFDNLSHSGGVQRGYGVCLFHEDCHKYRQVSLDAGSWQTTVAWLATWHALGRSVASKAEHSACRPATEQVEAVLARMRQ